MIWHSEPERLLEDISQGITESILIISREFRVLWANNSASRQCGLPKNKLIGKYCYEVSHRSDHPCQPPLCACPVMDLLKTGSPSSAEHEHRSADGRTISVEVSAYPVKNDAGEIVRFIHVSKDITERKRMEREREELIAELRSALSEIKTLSGIIPICSSCKKIRTDSGFWHQIEAYISSHSDAQFSHGICPHCADILYGNVLKEKSRGNQ